MSDWREGGEVYAFVDEAPPPWKTGARRDVLLDAIEVSAFHERRGDKEEGLCLVRVMSTRERLQALFRTGEINEGQWYRAKLRKHPGMPIAWILPAANNYGGVGLRTNLVALERLETDVGTSGVSSEGGKLVAWCLAASMQARRQPPANTLQLPQSGAGEAAPTRMHIRVLDVGHASCAALHDRREANSPIVGYCDVGRPIFFHAASAPGGMVAIESKRVPQNGFVILSHWDFDHYSLAVSHSFKGLQALSWYAPDQAVGPNAAKLQRNLGAQLSLIDLPRHSLGQGLTLFRGAGNLGDRNGTGNAVRLDQDQDNVLLPGDIGYSLIDSQATATLTGLVATHHGGSGGSAPPNGTGHVIVSYGKPNRYGHPVKAELAALRSAGWSVTRTAEYPGEPRGDRWLTVP